MTSRNWLTRLTMQVRRNDLGGAGVDLRMQRLIRPAIWQSIIRMQSWERTRRVGWSLLFMALPLLIFSCNSRWWSGCSQHTNIKTKFTGHQRSYAEQKRLECQCREHFSIGRQSRGADHGLQQEWRAQRALQEIVAPQLSGHCKSNIII